MSNETKIRHIRIADNPWKLAAEKAQREGMRISEVVRALLRGYVDGRFTV